VARDTGAELVILNIVRLGENAVYLQHIKYVDDEFRVVRE